MPIQFISTEKCSYCKVYLEYDRGRKIGKMMKDVFVALNL